MMGHKINCLVCQQKHSLVQFSTEMPALQYPNFSNDSFVIFDTWQVLPDYDLSFDSSTFFCVKYVCISGLCWGGRGGEICAIFSCKNNRHFEGLVTFPKIVFQYKYWSKYSYKSFTGVCFETQLHFCSLTLLSNICRKLFIHTEGIHINKDSSFHG